MQILREFEHSLPLPFFGIGMKMDLSGPMATAEFFRFIDIENRLVVAKREDGWRRWIGSSRLADANLYI